MLIHGKDKEDPLEIFSLDNACKFVYNIIHSIVSFQPYYGLLFIVSLNNLSG